MTDLSLPVFLVEDDPVVRHGCAQALRLAGFAVTDFGDAESALAALEQASPGALVSDVRLPGQDGLALLQQARRLDPELPVILITGHGDVTLAVQAMREGAYDFIEKPFPSERLADVTGRAQEKRALQLENRRLREQLQASGDSPLIGQTPAMQNLRRLVTALAPTGVDILLNGETGCGKEVVARSIHAASGRRGRFVALNCGALPESVFESEIFGHESGAFTGAAKRRIGKFELAHGGTLFLDEIESMPLTLQIKLLRALQERTIERLGGNEAIPVECRVIAASKADLKAESDAGRFRSDMYYRLNVARLDLPPLRERKADIPLLMAYFLQQAATRFNRPLPEWSAADLARWQRHDWPGNVRELRNVAERYCLGLGDGLEAEMAPAAAGGEVSLAAVVEAAEKACIETALIRSGGQVIKAAELLQLPRKTLYDKLHRHGLDPERYRR
ncbi:sigma-54-dependent transcriptional regulator [Pseudogulbenkiania ferrooxidans]|uniref:Two component, sigma54 specific, transcriptional regulator, Fis family n=1 Tax=Pseudogulbenkiania ferrooxidans 2002 TaxID=279714 RepID=B9Z1X1_9NEIS|nr:sigma-54 dependent transcriptional regulator [Pseudogulbenkiania ferrooxidans]EEG09416.1 two component, sigma54 specific, transcriptional regulator, Fis family [Pseudogulbenkiania ferrooxidans 2002]